MNASDHWKVIASGYKSDSLRGWDFRPVTSKKASLRGVFAVLAGALIVVALAGFYYLS